MYFKQAKRYSVFGRNYMSCLVAASLCLTLAACGGGGGPAPDASLGNAAAPIALTPKNDNAGGSNALTAGVDEAELAKAVERYRVTKQRNQGNYQSTGVDLNGDGTPEAVVVFSGEDWCVNTGCSLVIFQKQEFGYRPVSHVTRARPPLLVGPDSNFGWRDLIVNTGGGPAPIRTVRLGFSGEGYPNNALLQPEPVADLLARSQQIMADNPAFGTALNQ